MFPLMSLICNMVYHVRFTTYINNNYTRAFRVLILFVYNDDLLNIISKMNINNSDEFRNNLEILKSQNIGKLSVVEKEVISGKVYPMEKIILNNDNSVSSVIIFLDQEDNGNKYMQKMVISPGSREILNIKIDNNGIFLS